MHPLWAAARAADKLKSSHWFLPHFSCSVFLEGRTLTPLLRWGLIWETCLSQLLLWPCHPQNADFITFCTELMLWRTEEWKNRELTLTRLAAKRSIAEKSVSGYFPHTLFHSIIESPDSTACQAPEGSACGHTEAAASGCWGSSSSALQRCTQQMASCQDWEAHGPFWRG